MVLVLLIAFVMSAMAWLSPAASASSASASDLMLDPPLRPGSVFDQARLQALTAKVVVGERFHKVPAWLAGTWRLSRDGHFVLDPHRGADGKDSGLDPGAYVGFECGMIADNSGQVWTRDTVGSWSESASGNDFGCFLRYDETMPNANELRSHGETVAITTGAQAKIISCLRATTDQVNRQIGDEEIEIIKTSHSFDWQGRGKKSSQWKATYKRATPYDYARKIDKYGDLSLAFVQYLKDQNMVDRIPEALIIHPDAGVPHEKNNQ